MPHNAQAHFFLFECQLFIPLNLCGIFCRFFVGSDKAQQPVQHQVPVTETRKPHEFPLLETWCQ